MGEPDALGETTTDGFAVLMPVKGASGKWGAGGSLPGIGTGRCGCDGCCSWAPIVFGSGPLCATLAAASIDTSASALIAGLCTGLGRLSGNGRWGAESTRFILA